MPLWPIRRPNHWATEMPTFEDDGGAAIAMERGAVFSPCRTYRYALHRKWGQGACALFIGLNPSTADEKRNDPTIRRCIGFARSWGYDGLVMANLFAFRATQPADMKLAADPVGPDNDATLCQLAKDAGVVVAAWGAHGAHLDRGAQVRAMLPGLHHLRLTKDGHPGHPLYLPASLTPQLWLPS